MNVGDTYRDEDGQWRVLALDRAGRVRSAALIAPSQTFEAKRPDPVPLPEPPEAALEAAALAATDLGALQAAIVSYARARQGK